jgi:hypothetical protein
MDNLFKTLASNKLHCSELSSALKAHRQDPTPFYSGILQSTAKEFTRRADPLPSPSRPSRALEGLSQ